MVPESDLLVAVLAGLLGTLSRFRFLRVFQVFQVFQYVFLAEALGFRVALSEQPGEGGTASAVGRIIVVNRRVFTLIGLRNVLRLFVEKVSNAIRARVGQERLVGKRRNTPVGGVGGRRCFLRFLAFGVR